MNRTRRRIINNMLSNRPITRPEASEPYSTPTPTPLVGSISKLPLSIASKLKSFLSDDQSVASQFLRSDTLQQARTASVTDAPYIGGPIKKFQEASQKVQNLPVIKQVGDFMRPQNDVEEYLGYTPYGVASTVEKKVAAKAPTIVPKVFEGFQDLTTKILEKLKGKSVTSVLENGKFRAMPKNIWDEATKLGKDPFKYGDNYAEQFDISGKVDTENPIYKFYEKEVARYLKNKYGAKEIIDPQGVKWMEVDVKPEQKRLPIEAFGLAPIGFLRRDWSKDQEGRTK